jgi:phage shock protein C
LKNIELLILARVVLRCRHPGRTCRPVYAKGASSMQATIPQSSNVFLRDDTFFGVCQALGDDFGFNPLWLRLAFGVGLLWSPIAVLGAYAALGLVVLVSRLVIREPRAAVATASADARATAPVAANSAAAEPLAVAA